MSTDAKIPERTQNEPSSVHFKYLVSRYMECRESHGSSMSFHISRLSSRPSLSAFYRELLSLKDPDYYAEMCVKNFNFSIRDILKSSSGLSPVLNELEILLKKVDEHHPFLETAFMLQKNGGDEVNRFFDKSAASPTGVRGYHVAIAYSMHTVAVIPEDVSSREIAAQLQKTGL